MDQTMKMVFDYYERIVNAPIAEARQLAHEIMDVWEFVANVDDHRAAVDGATSGQRIADHMLNAAMKGQQIKQRC